jgi:cell division protein FtsQ
MSQGLIFRLIAWVLALTLLALPVVALLNGWFASERWPLRSLEIQAEFERVGAQQIRASVEPHLERGFFAVDLNQVRRVVEQIPWVEHAEVRKRWPDVLELRVVEHQAVALWGDDRLLSRSGELFAVPGAGELQGLLRLSGPEGRQQEVMAFAAYAQRVFSGSGFTVVELQLSGRGSWRLRLSQGQWVTLGRERPQERLARFASALPALLERHSAGFVSADLRYSNGFALRWPQPQPQPSEGAGS